MNKENIPCCFSEVNELGKHITNCNNLPTKLDKDNVQVRYFCDKHMIKVENIRRKIAQKYINEYKEKLILDIDEIINDKNPHRTYTEYVFSLKERIENGEFDND
ncbi:MULTISPECIES: hypothetical protein [unclassified Spiroplasma]|uniref:hypothetical protein n=2 Tax=unclassified Spiroplasma TaxID=2637901 RepID=UPI0027A6DC87|nr:MAG: hypothetical protein PPFGHCPK_01246 [Spiroplasma endosymbiont of Drosophila atripex]